MLGRKIGQYEIVRKIGQGGMGVVYEARHESLHLRAAIKVMRAAEEADEVQLRRFLDEARAVSSVQHNSLVRIFDHGRLPDGTLFMMMEYLEGESLAARLKRLAAPLPVSIALQLVRQVASALSEVHKKGIVHRDLTPSNILIVEDSEADHGERAKVLDFGIARFFRSEVDRTQEGTVVGTPRYMAPEQCEGAAQLDDRTDVYALGLVCFELLTGRSPYEVNEASNQAWFDAHRHQRALSLRRVVEVEKELSAFVAQMLDKDARQRPSMDEVAARLRVFLAASPDTRRAPDGGRTATAAATLAKEISSRTSRWSMRKSWPVIPMCLALIAGVVMWRWSARSGSATGTRRAPLGMVLIAGETFRMGSTADEIEAALQRCAQSGGTCLRDAFERERDPHDVTLTSFYFDQNEVTNQDYADWLNRSLTPRQIELDRLVKDGTVLLIDLHPARSGILYRDRRFTARPGYERKPVIQVSWAGARAYCTSRGQDLPTEAQWELAARGTQRGEWPWGDALPSCEDAVWARAKEMPCEHSGNGPADVGSAARDRTSHGVVDLAGNVEEWVLDQLVAPYPDCGACRDPLVTPGVVLGGNIFRVTRGGSWSQGRFAGRVAGRSRWREDYVTTGIGFRCAAATKR